jgi:site-specific DNA-methyltransferase (adenine-specific)
VSKINIKFTPIQAHVGASKLINDDWGTIAFSLPRKDIAEKFVDKEIRYNGIYFLFGHENGHEVVYVGQASKQECGESLLKRLRDHDGSKTESYRDKWDWAIAVTNKEDVWGSTELYALESYFIDEVMNIGTQYSLNGRRQNNGGADPKNYDDKITQIKAFITAIGFTIFDDIPEKENIEVTSIINEHSPVEDLHNGMARIPEIITPAKVVKAMVDMLPAEVWNKDTVFIDPACKGGEFLREVYERLMNAELMQKDFPDERERSVQILKNQIYGIALSQVSFDRATKKLFGEDRNLRIIPNYIEILKALQNVSKKEQKSRHIDMQSILNKEFGKDMKFNVVIGNPPYQESTGGGNNGGKVLYDKFIDSAMSLADTTCMIVKNNWMNSDSLKELRDSMLNNGLNTVINYSLLGDVFPTMGIAASIIKIEKGCEESPDYKLDYSEIQKGKTLNEYSADIRGLGFIPASMHECTIVQKVRAKTTKSFNDNVAATNPFGIDTNGALSKDEHITESIVQTNDYNIPIKYEKDIKYTNIDCFTKNKELVDKYKIICPKQIHKTNNPIPKVMGLKPNEICSGSFSLMYYSDDSTKAVNVYKYIETRFFRFLTYCLADSLCRLNSYRVSLVPDQDFTSASDIDWSQPISNIDKQLYEKYHLSTEEIAYIESTIKPMDNLKS